MRVNLESTSKFVHLNGLPARVWEGRTASGIPCHAFITRIAVDRAEDNYEFERELEEVRPPSAEVDRAYPSRLVL